MTSGAGTPGSAVPPEHDLKAQGAVLDLLLADHADGLALPDLERWLAGEIRLSAEERSPGRSRI